MLTKHSCVLMVLGFYLDWTGGSSSCISLQHFEGYECPSFVLDLAQSNTIQNVINCSVINGNLIITHLSSTQCSLGGLSLPNLYEILGTLTVEESGCNGDLANFLPNLVAIHGIKIFSPPFPVVGELALPPHSLLVHHTALSGIGLNCLRVLGTSGVLLLDNPQMCFVDTVFWDLLDPSYNFAGEQIENKENATNNLWRIPQPSRSHEQPDMLQRAGLYELCGNPCPSTCQQVLVNNRRRSFCWSPTHCQPVCDPKCLAEALTCSVQNSSLCCHPQCLGGCNGTTSRDCIVCRNFLHNGECIKMCPKPLFGLFGRHCVTREACLARPIPSELLSKSVIDLNTDENPRFSVYNGECVLVCPDTFRRSLGGECLPCGINCDNKTRDCGDIIIYQQADIASARGCVSARSVLISIRTGKDNLFSALTEAFSSLRKVHRSLRIIRSDALLSLSFLRHLTDIYGHESPLIEVSTPSVRTKEVSQITAMEVTWNGNLEEVWPSVGDGSGNSGKLRIHFGSVAFSVNDKLCPNEILKFVYNHISLGRQFTPSEKELIGTSNGEHALCKAVPLNVTVAAVYQASVLLQMERIAWNDLRLVLPPIITYERSEVRGLSAESKDRTLCDSTWNEVELNCEARLDSLQGPSGLSDLNGGTGFYDPIQCKLDNLAPATAYSAFITIAILSKHEGARSNRFQFVTKPATPSPPTFVKALSAGPLSIQLFWRAPLKPNGRVTEYRVRYWRMNLEKSDFLMRDACYGSSFQPLSFSQRSNGDGTDNSQTTKVNNNGVPGHAITKVGGDEGINIDRQDPLDDGMSVGSDDDEGWTSSPRSSKRSFLEAEEFHRREMIRFEDELHKIILIPRVLPDFSSLDFGLEEPHSMVKQLQINSLQEWPSLDGNRLSRTMLRYRREANFVHNASAHFVTAGPSSKPQSDTINTQSPSSDTIRVSVKELQEKSGSFSYLVQTLEHFTEYLFHISACHEPHDEFGNFLNRSEDFEDDDQQNAWCSQPVRISQRTQAISNADEIPISSLKSFVPPSRSSVEDAVEGGTTSENFNPKSTLENNRTVTATEGGFIGSESNVPFFPRGAVKQFWAEPCSPNGLILYYWLQYRRVENPNISIASTDAWTQTQQSPWFTICVTPQYYKPITKLASPPGVLASQDPVALGFSSVARNALPDSNASSVTTESSFESIAPCPSGVMPKMVFTDLTFLRPGFYEWKVMAVSLAGNSSWTQSHIFQVHDTEPKNASFFQTIQPVHLSAILVVTLFLVGIVVGFAVWFDYRARRRRLKALANQNSEYLESLLDKFSDEWEVDPKDLFYDLDATLGHGSFGMVFRGRLRRLTTPAAEYLQFPMTARSGKLDQLQQQQAGQLISGNGTTMIVAPPNFVARLSAFSRRFFRPEKNKNNVLPRNSGVDVAVKVLSPGATLDDVRDFLSEASHMKQFSCNHIVRLLGLISKQVLLRRQPIVLMELMEHGDLATYLRHRMAQEDYSQGSIDPELAIKWAAEIADGMAYLAHKGFVHRDLAARNCLVGGGLTVKIGDFGLTRDISSNQYYRKQGRARLPVRWMAPEALLEAYFTSKSDVWSYGVVLWEISTFAALPFSGLSHEEVISLVTSGGNLGKQGWPPRFPEVLLHTMELCWINDFSLRPSFEDILLSLDDQLADGFRSSSYVLSDAYELDGRLKSEMIPNNGISLEVIADPSTVTNPAPL